MKFLIPYICILMAFVSCTTKDEVSTDFTRNANDSTCVYTTAKGTTLRITNSVWFTTTTNSNSFGQVNLALTGTTNADKISIMTYGDGVSGERGIQLDTSKSFTNDTTVISFTHFSGNIPVTGFETSTILKAYKGLDTLKIKVNSGKLMC